MTNACMYTQNDCTYTMATAGKRLMKIYLSGIRLLDRPQSRVIARSHKELLSGETGTLCIESCSGVSILVIARLLLSLDKATAN